MTRTKRIEILMTPKEYEMLCQLAEADPDSQTKSGKPSLPKYIRSQLLASRRQKMAVTNEVRDLGFQIRQIGDKVNHAVYHLDAGLGSQDDVYCLKQSLKKIQGLLCEISEKVEDSEDGDYQDASHRGKQL